MHLSNVYAAVYGAILPKVIQVLDPFHTRAAMETASRAQCVLEGGLSDEHQTARYLAIEVYSALHVDRLAKAVKLTPRDPQSVPTQITEVKQHRRKARLRVTKETSECPQVGAERLPSATNLALALVGDTLFAHEGKGIYELGSGVTHGTSYALLRSYGIATGEQPSTGRLVSRLPVDQRIVESSIAMLLFAYVVVMKCLIQLTGGTKLGSSVLTNNSNPSQMADTW